MVATEPVDDPRDPRVAEFVGLTDAELRRGMEGTGGRHGRGLFIVEGTLAIGVLLQRRAWSTRSVLVTQKKLPELDHTALARSGAAVYVATQAVLNEVVGFDLHRGAVASADRPPPADADDLLAVASSVVMLEGIGDQENLGVLFRNAAALGADAVLLSPACCDPLYRRTVRVSMGHVLSVPFATTTDWPEAVDRARAAGFETVALTPDPDAEPIDTVAPACAKRAVLLGSEGPGLSGPALAAADRRVRIPMRAGIDSLNVANAAAIGFHRLFGAAR